jgi:hypothetical protein
MSQLVPSGALEYEPEWNEETQTFEDVCPFQSNRRSNVHVCYCKNLQGDYVYLKNKSQFDAHVLVGYHKKALHNYVIQKMILIKKELDRANKEKATLHVWVESEVAREKKLQSELRVKIEKQHDNIMELTEKNIELKRRLKQAEDLLHLQCEEAERYFMNKN